jgi:hypothetical protein
MIYMHSHCLGPQSNTNDDDCEVCELASLELRLHRLTTVTDLVEELTEEASVDTSYGTDSEKVGSDSSSDASSSTSDASSSMTGPGVSMIPVVSGNLPGADALASSSKNHRRSGFAHHGRAFCHANAGQYIGTSSIEGGPGGAGINAGHQLSPTPLLWRKLVWLDSEHPSAQMTPSLRLPDINAACIAHPACPGERLVTLRWTFMSKYM